MDGIRIVDLCSRKRPLYQLCHGQRTKSLLFNSTLRQFIVIQQLHNGSRTLIPSLLAIEFKNIL